MYSVQYRCIYRDYWYDHAESDGEVRGLFTDANACYQVIDDREKGGQYDMDVTPIEANQVSEEPLL